MKKNLRDTLKEFMLTPNKPKTTSKDSHDKKTTQHGANSMAVW